MGKEDLICFSHLRWNFVYQRPESLMSRCAQERRVFFIEGPVIGQQKPYLEIQSRALAHERNTHLWLVVPHLPVGLSDEQWTEALHVLIDELLVDYEIKEYILWYYTPTARPFTRHLKPQALVYDCMDAFSIFQGTNAQLCALDGELFRRADLVFTNKLGLYKTKAVEYDNVHYFPNSIDLLHFERARTTLPEPDDQKGISHPRLGFFGALDERLDTHLLAGIAATCPEWQIVLIGPIVKRNLEQLSKNKNIHYLGMKDYQSLPAYLAGWDVALLPFVLNESTLYLSTTKPLAYLAGGKPVVSTPISEIVEIYAGQHLVSIARDVDGFVQAIGQTLAEKMDQEKMLKIDTFLAQMSWGQIWKQMIILIDVVISVVKSGSQVVMISNSSNSHSK